ncbi:hypothetical protein [Paenibacillus sp. 2TAB19]|uniref:hypothetical protein n=1 Tax=Paenibacillus sp. 2TAB19 TaxID=3233003 RepID=UPI003F99B957
MSNLSAPLAKLSQWDALMLESLKSLGWPDEELIRKVVAGEELPKDDSKFHFDYSQLTAFAADNEATFQQAVTQGYQIKYNTIRGIHSWILVALGIEAELLLEAGEEQVIARLTASEADKLASVLSFGWEASRLDEQPTEDDRAVYRIAPASLNGSHTG